MKRGVYFTLSLYLYSFIWTSSHCKQIHIQKRNSVTQLNQIVRNGGNTKLLRKLIELNIAANIHDSTLKQEHLKKCMKKQRALEKRILKKNVNKRKFKTISEWNHDLVKASLFILLLGEKVTAD